jgi:hypothetical protein
VSWWTLTEGRQLSNDSTARGYLTPVGDSPQYDEALEREISRWIRGVSGLPAALVFPDGLTRSRRSKQRGDVVRLRYHYRSPAVKPVRCSGFGRTVRAMDMGTGNGDLLLLWPSGGQHCINFPRGNIRRAKQRELNRSGLSLVEAGTIYNLPELINNQWVRRYDLTITLSRKNIRTYNVRTLQDAPVSFSETKLCRRDYLYLTSLMST